MGATQVTGAVCNPGDPRYQRLKRLPSVRLKGFDEER